MSSHLQKLQLTYDQIQDRLVLTFYTQDFCEHRFWITRRMLKGFWDMLKQVSQMIAKDDHEKKEEEQRVQEQIQQEATQPQAAKYGTSVARRPLGDEPLLLVKLMARQTGDNQAFFHFEGMDGKNIEFACDSAIVTGLIQMVSRTAATTEWGLSLK